jgi:histidyl-tRNA synthetase
VLDPSVVRGLEYYTGPVFEAEITTQVKNDDGQLVRFGSVGGGGRYDGLVERFTGQKVPATGFSIGVSRLQAALAALGRSDADATSGPVVVLVMDKGELPVYQKLTQTLRAAGIRAEMYLGTAGMKAQMKYADKRGAPCVVIQGGDERAKGEVQIKDLIEGAKAAASIKDSKEWREGRPAQVSVPEARMVEAVREVLARHEG